MIDLIAVVMTHLEETIISVSEIYGNLCLHLEFHSFINYTLNCKNRDELRLSA